MVGGRITSTLPVAGVDHPRSDNSSTTVHLTLTLLTEILANVQSVYVNHLPSIIWLRIRSSITLSIFSITLSIF